MEKLTNEKLIKEVEEHIEGVYDDSIGYDESVIELVIRFKEIQGWNKNDQNLSKSIGYAEAADCVLDRAVYLFKNGGKDLDCNDLKELATQLRQNAERLSIPMPPESGVTEVSPSQLQGYND